MNRLQFWDTPKKIEYSATINDNNSMIQINGLGNVDHTLLDIITITNNRKLSLCHNRMTCSFLSVASNVSHIENNAPTCTSRAAINDQCKTVGTQQQSEIIVSAYHNPVDDQVTINGISIGCKINIYDSCLRLIRVENSSEPTISINTSSFINGVYFVKVIFMNQNIEWAKKIIIAHNK